MQQPHSGQFHLSYIMPFFDFFFFNFLFRPLGKPVIFFFFPSRILRLNNLIFHCADHLIFSDFSFSFAWRALWCLSLHVYVSVEYTALTAVEHAPIFSFLLNLSTSQADLSNLSSFRNKKNTLAKADTVSHSIVSICPWFNFCESYSGNLWHFCIWPPCHGVFGPVLCSSLCWFIQNCHCEWCSLQGCRPTSAFRSPRPLLLEISLSNRMKKLKTNEKHSMRSQGCLCW